MRRSAVIALASAAAPRLATSLSSPAHLAPTSPSGPSRPAKILSERPRAALAEELSRTRTVARGPQADGRRQPPLVAISGDGELLPSRARYLEQPQWHSKQREAFVQSFCVVGVAELFDKTWFVAVLCALNFGRRVAFWGAFGALAIHTLVAAILGVFISRLFSVSVLHFVTAGVFTVLAALYAYEWVKVEPRSNALEGRSEEAKDALPTGPAVREGASESSAEAAHWKMSLARCFMAVFVAEWGDRTQIAMISLHSSFPVLPVCLGSLAAFLALTISAVMVASFLEGQQLSEGLVLGISAASFLLFALLSITDGVHAMRTERLG